MIGADHPTYNTKVELERDKACRGELCLKCHGTNIKCVSANPDGVAMNYCYECLDCNNKWEGY